MGEKDSIFSSFEQLRIGDPEVTIEGVRSQFRRVITEVFFDDKARLDRSAGAVARCVILGIHPVTGEDLEDPLHFISSYPDAWNFGKSVRIQYYNLLEDKGITRILEEEKAHKKAQGQ